MAEDVFGIVGTTQAGNLHVEAVVAEGGFAVVYRALHGGFRAPVALKCLKIPGRMTPAQREAFLEKFREEVELLFRLLASIPEVVRPLHVDVLALPDRFVPFIALEWLEGEPFDQILEKRRLEGKAPMNLRKLMRMMRPIANALARAHRFNGPRGMVSIVHQDLKPENIFVSNVNGAEVIKILDFGIAKARSAATQRAGQSEDGMNAFTPAYGAPEQWVPKRFGTTGPWTDVWGFAITMVEALCGHPPIDGDLPAMMGTVTDEKRRPTPRAEGVIVSDETDAVFARALAVDPRQRTADLGTFWAELERSIGVRPSLPPRDPRAEGTENDHELRAAVKDDRAQIATLPALELGLAMAGASSKPQPTPAIPALQLELDVPKPPPTSARASSRGVAAEVQDDLERGSTAGLELADAPARSAAPTPPPRSPPAPRSSSPLPSEPSRRVEVPLAPVSAPRSFVDAPRSRPLAPAPLANASPRTELGDLRARLRRPIQLLAGGIAIKVVDMVVHQLTGETLMIGPLRPTWIAIPLALSGVGLAVWRVSGHSDD